MQVFLNLLHWPLQRGHIRQGLEIFYQPAYLSSSAAMQASLLYSSLIVITPQRDNSSTWKGTTLKFISNYKEIPNNFTWCFDFFKHMYI